MLVSGGKLIAIDNIKINKNHLNGDGVWTPLGINDYISYSDVNNIINILSGTIENNYLTISDAYEYFLTKNDALNTFYTKSEINTISSSLQDSISSVSSTLNTKIDNVSDTLDTKINNVSGNLQLQIDDIIENEYITLTGTVQNNILELNKYHGSLIYENNEINLSESAIYYINTFIDITPSSNVPAFYENIIQIGNKTFEFNVEGTNQRKQIYNFNFIKATTEPYKLYTSANFEDIGIYNITQSIFKISKNIIGPEPIIIDENQLVITKDGQELNVVITDDNEEKLVKVSTEKGN